MDLLHAAHITLLAVAGTIAASPLHAQSAARSTSGSAAQPVPISYATPALQDANGWNWLSVGKWSTAALATGAAVYGVVSNRRADHEYEELEQVCVDQPFRCSELLPNGAYADADIEARYQDVRALDRRARTGLIAGQIGVAASVVLFILDLRNADGPADIPYEPRTLDIMPARDGGMSLVVNLRMPRR